MMNELNATPYAELIAELMNPNNPKNEREHAAVREIERLREALAQPEQGPVVCKHEWFRTGAMEQRECRCIKCGAWNTTPPQRKEDK
jgi:uncharacterized cupin superfamily protein